MIHVDLTPADHDEARRHYDFRSLNESFTSGASRFYGAHGELVFGRAHPQFEYVGETGYDFSGPLGTVEIKTKRTTVMPRADFLCSVPNESLKHQQPDWFYFVRVRQDYSEAWLLGAISYDEFERRAVFFERGDIEPGTRYQFAADCWSVPVSVLNDEVLRG